jgi:dipeptidyl aminopeptidase/acylaminoacyl peptidase
MSKGFQVRVKTLEANAMWRIKRHLLRSVLISLVVLASGARALSAASNCNSWESCPIVREALVLIYPKSGVKAQLPIPEYFAGMCPAWSPGHTQIAFVCMDQNTPARSWSDPYRAKIAPKPDSYQGLYIINADGTGERHLTNDFDSTPSWSPDGTKIAFTRYRHWLFPEIAIYDLGTGKVRPLTNSADLCLHPAWSPNGKAIAFTEIMPHSWEIELQDVKTGKVWMPTNLPVGYCDFARWSPDGKKMLFVYSRSEYWFPRNLLYMTSSDWKHLRRLPLRRVTHAPAAWSPDMKRIAYVAWTKPGCVALYLYDTSGGDVKRLSPPPGVYYDRDEWPGW